DPRSRDGVALHVAHGNEAVDLLDAEPMQWVRHQLLKAHVLHAGDTLGAREVLTGAVATVLAFTRVVDQELRHLAEGSPFFAVVDDDPGATILRGPHALFDA